MSDDAPTKKEVVDHFKSLRSDLYELDKKLDNERRDIRLKAFRESRAQTPDETARRKEIAAQRLEIADALKELALETIAELDRTEDLQNLIAAMTHINAELVDDLENLKRLEEYAALADKVIKGLVKGVEKLSKLVV